MNEKEPLGWKREVIFLTVMIAIICLIARFYP
jgi:hypothetical protein